MKFLPLILSCVFLCNGLSATNASREISVTDKTLTEYISDCKKKYDVDLEFLHCSMNDYNNNLQQVSIVFSVNKYPTLEESRKELVTGVQTLLHTINNSKELRRYLINYPFTTNNLEFVICFKGADNLYVDPPCISCVALINQTVMYGSYDHMQKKFIDVKEEPYSDALRNAKEQFKIKGS